MPTAGENPKRDIKASKLESINRVDYCRDGSGEQVMQQVRRTKIRPRSQEGEEKTTMRSSAQQAVFVLNTQMIAESWCRRQQDRKEGRSTPL